MRSARSWVVLAAAGITVSATGGLVGVPAATAATHSHHPAVVKKVTRANVRGKQVATVRKSAKINFDIAMAVRHPAKARRFAMNVATPSSSSYHHFLTRKQWEKRFGPTTASLAKAEHWLRAHHYKVGKVPADRLLIPTRGSARQIEKNFGAKLGYYRVNGHRVRQSSTALRIPGKLGRVAGAVAGVNEYLARPADSEPAPPAGFRNPQPCASAWGTAYDKADSPSLYAPYSSPALYDICGYTPGQLRSAYNVSAQSNKLGKGATIAIVDAYDSPTLLADAQRYDQLNDPQYVLKSSQFTDNNPGAVDDVDACDASGWYDEQSLDVEAAHAMAPNANISYFGATDCEDGLIDSLNDAIDSGADVVTNSWSDELGDVFNDPEDIETYEDIFTYASGTGVSVMFSSGDDGDNFADFGFQAANYPASDPLITAVGGTSLEINRSGQRVAEPAWSTGKQVMCTSKTVTCGSARRPAGAMTYNAGAGGGTSYTFAQPSYQAGVVPTSLSEKNSPVLGPVAARTVPDIALDADAQTGMLIGLTQTFGNTVRYDQFKEGGTSLASPLLAGVTADAVAQGGSSFGLLNPLIYQLAAHPRGAIYDVTPLSNPKSQAVVRVDYTDTQDASQGYTVSLRAIDYEGPETYCDGDNNCATRPVTLNALKGYDEITGVGSPGNSFITDLSRF